MRLALPELWGELCTAPHLICPPPCVGCGCASLRPVCTGCARESKFHLGPSTQHVSGTRLKIQRLGSYGSTDHAPTPIAKALHRFKYRGDRSCGRAIVWLATISAALLLIEDQRILVPVPLSRPRLRARGFNQAAWIARGLAASLDLDIAPDLLRRTDQGKAQAGLGRAQRHRQRPSAFSADPVAAAGADILLVDDVVTTGTTLINCAGELIHAGARSVRAVTLLGVPQYY
jgi:ComF family protein